jgi:hypothetical protein
MPKKSKSKLQSPVNKKKSKQLVYSSDEESPKSSKKSSPLQKINHDSDSECDTHLENEHEVQQNQQTITLINLFRNIEYIDYNMISKIKYKAIKGEDNIKVKCFYNGDKWICPNPFNTNLCNEIENWYNSSHCMKLREILMSMEQFKNVVFFKNDPIILSEL